MAKRAMVERQEKLVRQLNIEYPIFYYPRWYSGMLLVYALKVKWQHK